MARGRDAEYIRNRLCISRNTVNTHIAHIYRKTGVHSRQELIDLVEQAERRAAEAPARSARPPARA